MLLFLLIVLCTTAAAIYLFQQYRTRALDAAEDAPASEAPERATPGLKRAA